VVHVTPEMSVQVLSDLQNIRCPIPLFGCPNPNKTECPDLICGDRLLKRVINAARDDPRDTGRGPSVERPE
jgi:hypothetical protein